MKTLRVFINDFSKILKSERSSIGPDMFNLFHPCLSCEENRELVKEVVKEEIFLALSEFNGLYALGLNGLQANLYRKY